MIFNLSHSVYESRFSNLNESSNIIKKMYNVCNKIEGEMCKNNISEGISVYAT